MFFDQKNSKMVSTIFISIFGIIILFILHRLTIKYKPSVSYNPNGNVSQNIEKMKCLKDFYKPTPWLICNFQHTLWGMRDRPQTDIKYTREDFTFSDGGSAALDWFPNPPTEAERDVPVIVICHTFCGGSREPCTSNIGGNAAKHGWKAVVANCRGCSGSKFTGTDKFFNNYDITDLQEIIEHVREKSNTIFLVGYSYGSVISAQYAARDGRVKAACLVSNPSDMEKCSEYLNGYIMRKYFRSFIMSKLHHIVSKDKMLGEEVIKRAVDTEDIRAFDDAFTVKTLGFKDRSEYYEKTNLIGLVDKMKCPTLYLVADDDPFTRPNLFPIKEIENSQNMAIVHTPEGGHVSFLTGMDAKESFADTVVLEWFDSFLTKTD